MDAIQTTSYLSSVSKDNASLLFIPDISGFTHFVHATEIEHSQFIIGELLNVIIESNDLGLIVSEIEGDAVLFYKHQSVPTLSKIVNLTQKMFIQFHNHLVRFEDERVCDCNACRTAANLTLKVFAHKGNFNLMNVQGFQKPYGTDVILIHRLMKNDIPDHEYLLVTEGLLDPNLEQNLHEYDWINPIQGSSTYESFGKIPFSYIPLAPLHKQVIPPKDIPLFSPLPDNFSSEALIHAPIDEVFNWVSRLELRNTWQVGVKDVKFDPSTINRVGTQHTCVLPAGTLVFETIKTQKENGKRKYAEKLQSPFFVEEQYLYIELTEHQDGTHASFQVHYKPKKGLGKLLATAFAFFSKSSLPKALGKLKEIVEK